MKTKFQFIIFALYLSAIFTQANNENISLETDHNLKIYKDYVAMDKQLRQFMDKGMKMMLPYILEANENLNISSTCMDNMFQFMTGLRKLTEWSVSILDSIGKPQSGMMSGNMHMLGEAHQCFNAVAKKKDRIRFRGQYCSIQIQAILPDANYKLDGLSNLTQHSSDALKMIFSNLRMFRDAYLYLGICVPSGCMKEDISQMFNYLTQKISYINATVLFCLKEEDTSYWSSGRISVLCFFVFLGMLIITSTIFDSTVEKSKKKKIGLLSNILECFSVTRNFPKLINTNSSAEAITCFYGIRVLTVFWIILCHEYLINIVGLLTNHLMNIEPFIKSFFGQIIMNGFSATDVFFFMGGFVNSFTRIKLQKNGKSQPSILNIIIHRLWRIYPAYIVAFLTLVLLSRYQPAFHEFHRIAEEPCTTQWWKNFLFINNFFRPFEVCLSHTWYLSVDMQIFLLSLITIPILLRKEKLGIYLHIGVIIIANICSFLIWWIQNLPPSPGSWPMEELSSSNVEYSTRIYMLPFTHIAPYYIGILIGYVTASKKEKQFSKTFYFLGWMAASFSYTTALFLTYRWNSGTRYTRLESSLYGAFSTTVTGLCLSWMVYCCKTGQARLVNYILSLKIWIPLSRLTFMLYLISFIVQQFNKTNLNFLTDFESVYIIWSYFGNLSISLLMSLGLVLIAESPLMALEKMIFRKKIDVNKSLPEVKKEDTDNDKKETDFIENLNHKNSA